MSIRNIILAISNIILAILLFVWWSSMQMPAVDSTFSQHPVQFDLQHDRKPFSEKELQDQVALILLGDMYCPDACPELLMRLGTVLGLLDDEERAKVKVLFINLDPSDRSSEVEKLARFFHPHLIGLSGQKEELQTVASTLFFDETVNTLETTHPHHLVIVRPDGYVAKHLASNATVDTILADIRIWMTWAKSE